MEMKNMTQADNPLTAPPGRRVLIVEDDDGLRSLIAKTLGKAGYETEGASSGAEALERCSVNPEGILLIDQGLPDMTGKSLVTALRQRGLEPSFLIITGQGDERLAVEMMKLGAFDYLTKDTELYERLPLACAALFQRMEIRARLQAAEQALSASEQRYQSITEQLTEMLFIHDLVGKILEVNRAAADGMGYTHQELLGMSIFDLHATHEGEYDTEKICRQWMAWPVGNRVSFEREHRRKDGSVFPVEIITGKVILDGSEVVIAIVQDITARKLAEEKIREDQIELQHLLAETEHSRQALLSVVEDQKAAEDQIRKLNIELEERVRDRTAQLEFSNKELEAFSYSVSHDLRAPLRGIDGWSQALKEDYEDQLDEKGRQFIDRIRGETVRMGKLIEGLLDLSRITRLEMNLESLDLSALAQDIWDRSEKEDQRIQYQFTIQPDLVAAADRNLISIVLTNLIGNAVKFSSKNPHPIIEFGKATIDGNLTFFVRDNGAGFDMAFAKNLFGTFQRMHKQPEFPGTGVGLSTVQRIINRHGGKVWAEAKVNEGATFYFTLSEDIRA